MSPFHTRTAVWLLAILALSPTPSFAQRSGRQDGGNAGGRQAVERAQPRGGSESRGRRESQRRAEPRGRADVQAQVAPRGRVESYRAYDNRVYQNRVYDSRSFGNRPYVRPYAPPYVYRPYVSRPHISGPYVRPYPYAYRTYTRPLGYRPYGYGPGWSLNFYFGRPYAVYGYPGYARPAAGYGYYAIAPGRAYGALRIVDAPRDAQVFVDGYYAGVVDDYDNVFQHLNLEAGPHHIEIEAVGYPPIGFDVRIEAGQTITYRANIR